MFARLLAVCVALVLAPGVARGAQVIVVNGDPAGVGFNDPTPATPVGGNPGTTVGAQALNVFQVAANRWGSRLVSVQPIYVIAFFTPLACTATSAVLGAAGANWYFADIPPVDGGKELRPNTWYPAALAEKITRQDIVADPTDPFEIFAVFNSRLGQGGCLTGNGWYYGLDNTEPANQIDLLAVVLHEFGHGLGFSAGPTNTSTGVRAMGFPSVWETHMLDTTSGKRWIDMSDAERAVSARNDLKLVWAGQFASNVVPSTLSPGLLVEPRGLGVSGSVEAQPATFGGAPVGASTRGPLADAADGGGVSAYDGCEPYPATARLAGTVVLVNRGTCAFVVKAGNAQAAGAIALVIANNAAGILTPGGTSSSIVIPVVGVTQAAGAALRAALPLTVTVREIPTVRSGTVANYPRLYAPPIFRQGSSVSHWDVSATPNMLMEPFINSDLRSSVKNPDDLTWSLLRDVGW